ncbi:hypothetical protein IL306_001038 [Fusarium sp. DS 682]|nr:hypothetical protein IL306_001038 [Fusarium sp. DS 682]
MLNVTVTVSTVESTAFGLTSLSTTDLTQAENTSVPSSSIGISSRLLSSTVHETADETMTITVIPQQNSSQLSTADLASPTDSEEHQTSGNLATGSTGAIITQSTLTEISVSESTQQSSVAPSIPTNGSVNFTTTTTYFTTTLGVPASSSSLSKSSGSPNSTVVASGDSSGAGTGGSSAIVVSSTVTLSTILTTSKTYTALNFTSPVTDTAISSVPTSMLNASLGLSESEIATAPLQSSSETLIASTALPINATSEAVTSSFTVVTVSESSVITIFPGGIIPTGSVTSLANSSVSTEYSTSTPSRFNSSTSIRLSSLPSQTGSLFEWPTSTLTGSQTSEVTLEVPSLSFPTSWLSIITTPMTPPSVSTTPTRSPSGGSALGNITVIKTTMTSTITSSLLPTHLTLSGNVTAAHTTSGYNFSDTVGSATSTFKSWSTSLASFPGISTIIISGQPTNLPFPTNTTVDWRSTFSMSWSGSNETISSQGPGTVSSIMTTSFNSTAPYINSTTITAGETSSTNTRGETRSIITTGASGPWNTTSIVQRFTNSTTQVTVTATSTGSDLGAGTQILSDTAVISPQPPTSLNVTLTTISGSVYTKTFTDVTITIITPTFSVTSDSNTLSTVLASTPPFPFPSNTTATGTGVPFSPSGTGTPSTITSSSGELPTYSTMHWLNMTHTFGVKDTDTSTDQPLTTLRTVTKERAEESGSTRDDYPTPTDRVPEDPNFPWGNDSPIHRHQNSSELGVGTGEGDGDGGLSERIDWRLQWDNVKDKLKRLCRGQALEAEG